MPPEENTEQLLEAQLIQAKRGTDDILETLGKGIVQNKQNHNDVISLSEQVILVQDKQVKLTEKLRKSLKDFKEEIEVSNQEVVEAIKEKPEPDSSEMVGLLKKIAKQKDEPLKINVKLELE